MDLKYSFIFFSLYLSYKVTLGIQVMYEPNNFHYSRCEMGENNVTCERLNMSKEWQEEISVWPPGPYAIPRSIFGCPESQSQGWSRGVLKVLYMNPDTNINVGLLLQFCVKLRHNQKLDKGVWIPGNYNIYMKGISCPSGFKEFNRTIFHGVYNTKGYIPNIAVSKLDDRIPHMNISMCARTNDTELEPSNSLTFGMTDTTFMLEKNGDFHCPAFEWNTEVKLPNDTEKIYCLYDPPVENGRGMTKMKELISEYNMSKGYIPDSGISKRKFWYLFDLHRSLSIAMIDIFVDKYVDDQFDVPLQCFYDDLKWSFLYHEAWTCKYSRENMGERLVMRNVQGRFVTLLFHEDMENIFIKVYISNLNSLRDEICNEDLGMRDGSIQDFQITASSWLATNPPSSARPLGSGWCPDRTVSYRPWILVDLIVVTKFEGVSILYGQSGEGGVEVGREGYFVLVYYGTSKDELQISRDMVFEIDLSKSRSEEQTLMFLMPVKARFIKLDPHTNENKRCLRFELHGCKLAVVPALNYCNASEMFQLNTETKIEYTSTEYNVIYTNTSMAYTNTSIAECKDLCLKSDNCSVIGMNSEEQCVQYGSGYLGNWEFNLDSSGYCAIKLCVEDQVEMFPWFKDQNDVNITNVQYIERAAIITSIGYPFTSGVRQPYTWIINFHEQRYVRFVFTNVSLNYKSERSLCQDKLLIGTHFKSNASGAMVDNHFNGELFVIETSESLVFATLIPCREGYTSSKFRAIITGEETPACLSIYSGIDWSKWRKEICTETKMILTSMSILNIPFGNVVESFEIQVGQHLSIRIEFIDFYVICPLSQAQIRSKFTLVDPRHYGEAYCNTNMPPKTINSQGSFVYIEFISRDNQNTKTMRTEGFRLQYIAINHSLRSATDIVGSIGTDEIDFRDQKIAVDDSKGTTACSMTFKKCYNIFSAPYTWNKAASICKKHNMDLVTVHSKQELDYVHYLLREQRYQYYRGKENYKDSSFRAHIGLRRYSDKQRRKRYVWMNNYDMTISAWRNGQPATGDCTRTFFQPFNKDSFWESEDCSTERADFFMCQEKMAGYQKNGTDEIKKDVCEIVQKKIANVFTTFSGKTCQSWNNLSALAVNHFKETFPSARLPVGVSNHCADPSYLGIIWCYVEDQDTLWEPCFLQQEKDDFLSGLSTNKSDAVFTCSSQGSEIPREKICDKSFDCQDFTDEIYCMDKVKDHDLVSSDKLYFTPNVPARLEEGSYYLCGSKEWISMQARCDGVFDCLDASDEVDCLLDKEECEDNQFSCGDGNCIQLSQVCDFRNDCADKRDEFCAIQSCPIGEYSCVNKQCISRDKRCNAVPDCIDKSDETDCDSCKDSFHCDTDKCIPLRHVCDKFPDCDDGGDENSCQENIHSSCNEWWESGFHKSGEYIIQDGISVYCDFSSVIHGRMNYELRNIDVDVQADALYTMSSDDPLISLLSRDGRIQFLFDVNNNCSLEVRTTCRFPYDAASLIDDPDHRFAFQFCRCMEETFKTYTYTEEIIWYGKRDVHSRHNARNRRSVNKVTRYSLRLLSSRQCGEIGASVTGTDMSEYYSINKDRFSVADDVVKKVMPVDVTTGQLSCSYEYKTDVAAAGISCEKDNTTLPSSTLCLYDVDASGYMTGCRSGGHLQSCGDFRCPIHTVKCPGSYCIPLRYVCDGSVQCPGGEDEHDCYCTDEHREVIVLIEDQPDSKTAVKRFAHQFDNARSVVKLLYYTIRPPVKGVYITHKLLDIREERANHFERISHPCRYKIMARNLLPTLRLKKMKSSGFVFIEDSAESSTVADLILSNLTKPSFSVYRVTKDVKSSMSKPDKFRFVKDIHIGGWSSFFQTGYRHFPEICRDASQVPCIGGYRCSSSKQCIPFEQVCDGVVHCSNSDDEQLCDFICPEKCRCIGQVVICRAANIDMTDISVLSIHTRKADISQNPGIKHLLSQDNLLRFPFMFRLNISSCEIETFRSLAFLYINNLISLDIGKNRLIKLPENAFKNLNHLTYLNLDGNSELSVISSSTFRGLRSIRNLRISGTKLKLISSHTFSDMTLQVLDISNNSIEEIEDFAFNNISVQRINFERNNILKFRNQIFHDVTSLQELRTPAFKFCCIRPCYVDERNCYPSKNEFSSCGDLMRHPVLQAALWIVGIASLLGNLGSIFYRLVYDRERLKIGYGIFVTNLAAADFLMGVYLIMIATVDSLYRTRYIFMDDQWRNSTWCVMAGILSTVSSEASVFFLCLITLDRLMVIKYPLGKMRFGPLKAYLCCGICWVIAIALAFIPVIYTSYFKNSFYSRSGVCIALPLTRDKPPGWVYSVSIFVGLNFCTFILVAFGQLSIFIELRKATSGMKKTLKSRKRDLQVARNLILVATTDFLCWFPIGLMGILALNGHPISGDVYAWTAVFILPFNSALNPVLYTLTAIIGKRSFNPSVDEQSRAELKTEVGSAFLKGFDTSRYVRLKRDMIHVGKLKSLDKLMKEDGNLSVAEVTVIATLITKYLSLLDEYSVGLKRISETNTYIRVSRKKQRNPIIVIDTEMCLSPDRRLIQDNIYQFGQLLRKMTAHCNSKQK